MLRIQLIHAYKPQRGKQGTNGHASALVNEYA